MNIAALSIGMSQASVRQQAGFTVMKMAMDASKASVANFTEMLPEMKGVELSVQPYLGGNIDVQV